MINKYIRKDLANFKPYHAPAKEYNIKIDANENPYSHKEEVVNELKKWLENKENITRYPDTDSNVLREKIASVYGVSKDNVTCGVGSDQLIELIIKVFIEPDDVVLVPNPSFSMYGLSTILNHGKIVEYELEEDFAYSINKLIDLYKEINPKIIFLCTPNNPTGTILEKQYIKELLEVVKCPVVIDEAYAEFISDSMIEEIYNYSNIIVLRTFSKAFGLAGLRVGYGVGSKDIIEAINICKPPYNLSSLSQKFAELILDNRDYYLDQVNKLNENRDDFKEKLKNINIIDNVFPSCANFILVKSSRAKDIVSNLEQNKILVRGYGIEGRLANCIRITIGTKEENDNVIAVLNSIK
jgi:histidinol-phosphate aminotransferase